MIEQAVAAGRKILAAEEAKEAEEDAEVKIQADRASEEDERDRLERYKKGLTPEEQAQLREDALQKLSETPGIKSEYIVDALVEVMENDLIRKSGVDIRQEGLESADNVSEEQGEPR